jgi:hypothetical protein
MPAVDRDVWWYLVVLYIASAWEAWVCDLAGRLLLDVTEAFRGGGFWAGGTTGG